MQICTKRRCGMQTTTEQAATFVNIKTDDEEHRLKVIEALASGGRPSSFTLPAVSKQTRTLAGYVHASFADQTLTITHCKVDRPHQGRGLGGLLIEAAEKRAEHLGAAVSKVKLLVLETNEPARKCYAKSGFQVCGESPSIFPPCNCPEDSCHCANKIKWLSMEKCAQVAKLRASIASEQFREAAVARKRRDARSDSKLATEHLWTRSFAAAQWPNSRSAVAYPLTMTPGAACEQPSFSSRCRAPRRIELKTIMDATKRRRYNCPASQEAAQLPGKRASWVEKEDTSLERSHLAFRTRDEISPMACDSAHPRSRNPHGHYDQPLLIPKSCCIRCSLARASEFILDLEAKCELPVAWYSSGLFTGWPSQRRCDACSLGPRRKQANSPQPPEKKNTGSDGSSFFAGRQSRWWTPGDLSSSTRGLYLQAKPKTISRLLHSEMPPVRPH
eukprot:s813_g2.t5